MRRSKNSVTFALKGGMSVVLAIASLSAVSAFAGGGPAHHPAASDLGRSRATRTTDQRQLPPQRPRASRAAVAAPIRRIGSPSPLPRRPTALPGSSVSSSNWAGYDATGGGFSSVTASWTQPAVLPDASQDSVASFWVGLDGDGSPTVEQIGTQAENSFGSVSYIAWYEMYPASEVPIPSMIISPGDVMTGTVTSTGGGSFTLALFDATTGSSFTKTSSSASAQRYSAEVVAEAPSSGSTVLPLANFGTAHFTDCAFNGKPISAFAYNQIDLASGSTTLAATSALGADGASFSVTSYPSSIPATTVTGFSPRSGKVGTSVTVIGTGFTGADSVTFNGRSADFTIDSDAQITVTVPAGASSGPISVSAPGGPATSTSDFTVLLKPTVTLKLRGLANGVVRLGKSLTARGKLRPASLATRGVSLIVQRKNNGRWRVLTSRVRTISVGGFFRWTYTPAKKGRYRMKAAVASTASTTAAKTPWRPFAVK